MSDERRAYQRLTLSEPLDGWFGDFAVRLVDVSASGAQIEHDEPIPSDARALLRFYWRGEEVEVLAQTARQVHTNRVGIRFLEESETLRTLIAMSAADVLRALEANARGDRAANVVGDETLTSAWRTHATGYVRWELEDGHWTPHRAREPDQPKNGFTISAKEPDEQVEMLRRTYETGDAEARRLTRMLAELSVLE
ncbi:MAG TPA: PilZ domain-containing protein [Thermoanaerobaculia bacterium]|nr:PilZ domain-containing protein [Thermoanaerobaculia bacterium]